jgi:hypothetical protein
MRWRALATAVLTMTTMTTMACDDPCATRAEGERSAEIGVLSGASTFEPFVEGDTVELSSAPQGGRGIFTAVRTVGLEAHLAFGLLSKGLDAVVRVIDETSGTPDVLGDFSTSSFISCVDSEGGLATEIVFGLDSDRFGLGFQEVSENDAALGSIDGHTVTLEAVLTDDNSAEHTVRQQVVLDTLPDAVENP